MQSTTPSDLLSLLRNRALPKRLLRVGLALSSTIYGLRPALLLAKSASPAGKLPGGWLGESGLAPLELPDRPARSRSEVFFIDAGVADPGAFWFAAPKSATVVCIPAGVDSWEFMAQEAEKFRGLGAIHLVSHGAPGTLVLNGRRYAAADLAAHAAQLRRLGRALTKNGDIFLYGCEAGAGREGQALLNTLAAATGADIAASSEDTGSKAKGGHWDLEVTTGPVDRSLALDAKAMAGYDYVLFAGTANSVSTLKADILTASNDGSDDTITITGNITFATAADAITIDKTDGHTLSIVGGGFTLSGNNLARVLNITGGSVALSNLTISNGFVTGAGGKTPGTGAGLAGGDALGANILNAGTLAISNCTITGGKAAGGGGGGGGQGAAGFYGQAGNYGGGAGGGGGGFGTTFGGAGGTNFGIAGGAGSAGTGGTGAGSTGMGGLGGTGAANGSGSGGAGSTYGAGYTNGGNGGTAANGTTSSIGGGGGGAGYTYAGGRGGNAAGGIYNTGTLTITGSTITSNIGAGGGGGGGASSVGPGTGNGGAGGSGVGGIWNAGGTLQIDASTNNSFTGGHNIGGAGAGGQATAVGFSSGSAGTPTATISTTNSGSTITNFDDPPVVTTTGGITNYVSGTAAVTIDSGVTVSDPDNSAQASGTVTIGSGDASGDTLAFTNNSATLYGNISALFSGNVLTLTSSPATATDAQWANAFSAVKFSSTSTSYGSRTILFVVNDGAKNSATANDTVNVENPNPVVTTDSGSAAFVAGDNTTSTPVVIDSGLTVIDPGTSVLASARVTITGSFHSSEDVLALTNNPGTMGNIAGVYSAGTLTLTSAGNTASIAQWRAALEAVTYTDTAVTPNTATRTISFSVTDGSSNVSNTATRNVTVADTDQTPIITTSGGSAAFVAGNNTASTPVVVDPGLLVSKADNTPLASATVTITGNFHSSEDVLAFTNDGLTMGNIAGVYSSGTLTLTSSGDTASIAQWQAALRAATYTDTAVTPNTATRTISFVVSDGTVSSNTATRTVTVADTDQTPIITTSGGSAAFVAGNNTASTPVVVDAGVVVSKADNAPLASATVTITGKSHGSEDVLAFTNNPATMGNIAGVYSSGTLTLTSSGDTASIAQWQAALRSVTYTDTAVTPNNATRTISFVVSDGTVSSNTATRTVTVADTDQTPIITTSGGSAAFVAGNNTTSTPVVVDPGLLVSKADNNPLASATVTITGNFHSSEDVLAFTNNPSTMGNIAGSYSSGTGVLTLTSTGDTATLAQWQAALRSVTYTDTAVTPNTATRTISFVVSDGTVSSNTATRTVTVADTDQAPIVTTSGGSAAFVAGNNTASTPVAIDPSLLVSKADSNPLASATVTITGNFHSSEDVLAFTNNPSTMGNIAASYNSSTGVLTLTSSGDTATLAQWQAALRAVTYTDTAVTPNTATRTISFTVTDASSNVSNTATRTVTVADTDQTPIVTTTGGSTSFYEAANTTPTPVVVDPGITVSKLDNTPLASATVTITGNFHSSEDMLAFTNNPATMGNIAGSYNSGTGVLTLTSSGDTATIAQWQAALRAVTYADSSSSPNTSNRTVSFVVSDGTASSLSGSKTVIPHPRLTVLPLRSPAARAPGRPQSRSLRPPISSPRHNHPRLASSRLRVCSTSGPLP